MAETSIQWCDYTFNGWVGCARVSPGCQNCYAETYDKRVGGVPVGQRVRGAPQLRWGPDAPRTRTSANYWRQPLKWNAAATAAGERRRVFCSSLADVFEDRPDLAPMRFDLFDLIRQTPSLDWLLLTKRPRNIPLLLSECIGAYAGDRARRTTQMLQSWVDGVPPSNVWLGATVEDQRRANERIPQLLAASAAVRFLSCEPLLEAVDPTPYDLNATAKLHWVIIGGESGAKARPFRLEWARSLVLQCQRAGAKVFMKQLGAHPVERRSCDVPACNCHSTHDHRLSLDDSHGGDPAEWPPELRIREFPTVRR